MSVLETGLRRLGRAHLLLLVAAALVAVMLSGCGTASHSTMGAIAGFVTTTASSTREARGLFVGTPGAGDTSLSHARVLLDSGQRLAYTNAHGEFFMGGVAPGRHTITVSHPDAWAPLTFAVQVLAGQTVQARKRLGRGYYVLIGIDDYQSPDINDLSGPGNDVRAIGAAMGAVNAADVKILTGPAASKSGVQKAIADDAARMGDEDYMVFYFSGHGDSGMPAGSPLGAKDFICPWDTNPGIASTVITDGELVAWLCRIPGQNGTVILDSCHSGSFADGVETRGTALAASQAVSAGSSPQDSPVMQALSRRGNFVLLAAAQANQDAMEVGGHGLFTTALVEALGASRVAADADGDRVISTRELYQYACARLKRESAWTTQVPFMWPSRVGFDGPAVARY